MYWLQVRSIGNQCAFRYILNNSLLTLRSEVVLSILLENFHFDLCPDKKYSWKLGGITTPGIEDDPVPKLPMRVSLVKS